jgi:hypothetical protein
MSLAIVIKNTILVILIILIGHFMVKNFLLDKKNSLPVYKQEPNKELGGALVPIKNELAPSPIVPENETPLAKPSSDPVSLVQGGLDKAKEELLKFIDGEGDDDIEGYFGNDTVLGTQPTDNCKPKTQDTNFPLSTTCNPDIQSLPNTDKDVKANCNLNQIKKNVMLINEYDGESTMNGGALYGGLSAFDAFDNNYQAFCN